MLKLTGLRTLTQQGRRRLLSRTALCGALCCVPIIAHAQVSPPPTPAPSGPVLPVGGLAEVNAGGGAPVITTTDTSLDVKLNAPRTILSWTTYNVGADRSVNYAF